MLKKSKDYEVWFHVKDGKKVGLLGRVPELLRLNLISLSSKCNVLDLNMWLYISNSYDVIEFSSFEDAEADLN